MKHLISIKSQSKPPNSTNALNERQNCRQNKTERARGDWHESEGSSQYKASVQNGTKSDKNWDAVSLQNSLPSSSKNREAKHVAWLLGRCIGNEYRQIGVINTPKKSPNLSPAPHILRHSWGDARHTCDLITLNLDYNFNLVRKFDRITNAHCIVCCSILPSVQLAVRLSFKAIQICLP